MNNRHWIQTSCNFIGI